MTQTEGTGPPVTDDLASQVRLLQEKLTALTATGLQKEGRGNYRGRGRDRGGEGGRGSDTMTCYGGGKKGHIRRDCPKDKNNDTTTPTIGFRAVVVTSPMYDKNESIILSSPSGMSRSFSTARMDMGLFEEEIRRPARVTEYHGHVDRSSHKIQVLLRRQPSNFERGYKITSLRQAKQENPIAIYDKGNNFPRLRAPSYLPPNHQHPGIDDTISP